MAYRQGMTFQPRSMVEQPDAFGHTSSLLRPAPGIETTDHRYRAAMVQHVMARRIREGLKLRGQKVTTFVEEIGDVPGASADRVRRLLRGETSATFADLAFWSMEFPTVTKEVVRYLEHWTKATDGAREAR